MKTKPKQLGAAYIWLMVSLSAIIGFLGMGLDTANMVLSGQQLQIVADSAALAGARWVQDDETFARDQAVFIAGANSVQGAPLAIGPNYDNASDGDVVFGQFDRDTGTFTAGLSPFNAVQVSARRTDDSLSGPLPLFFGPFFGLETVNIGRSAIAMTDDGGGMGAGVIVLNESERYALDVDGNADLIVNNGAVQVNSNDSRCTRLKGNADLYAGQLNIAGGLYTQGNAELHAELNTGASVALDPLADVPEPTWDPGADNGFTWVGANDNATLQPGYYSGGIRINGNADVVMEPGVYVLDGIGLDIQGNADVIAEGVMFYIKGTGRVEINGNGDVTTSSPGSGDYEGIGLFQARDNTTAGLINGNSDLNIEGTYYFPSNHMDLSGNTDNLCTQLIVDTMTVTGNGDMVIEYDGRFPIAGDGAVFLVR